MSSRAMWKAWRVPPSASTPPVDARQMVDDLAQVPPECRLVELSPDAIVRIHVTATAAGAGALTGGALDLTSAVVAPELVYVPPCAWLRVLRALPAGALVTGALNLNGLTWAPDFARRRLPGDQTGTLVHFLRNVHANERGLFALGDLVFVLWHAARNDAWPRQADDLDAFFVDESGARVPETAQLLWVYIDPGRDAGAIGAADPRAPRIARSLTLRPPETPWPLFLRLLAQGEGTVALSPDAQAQTVTTALRALRALADGSRVADTPWIAGAVVLPERTRVISDALAWGDPRAARDSGAPSRPLVAPVAAYDVPRFAAWLRANPRVAADLYALHALSLARVGISVPDERDAWRECKAIQDCVQTFRSRARDFSETRQLLRAVACMATIETATGSAPGMRMDAASALFVWMVSDALRRVCGQTATALLPIPDAAAAVPPAAAPAEQSDAAALLAQMKRMKGGANPRAQARVSAEEEAQQRAAGRAAPGPRAESEAITRIVVWHAAFLDAVRTQPCLRRTADAASYDVLSSVTRTMALASGPADDSPTMQPWMEDLYPYASMASRACSAKGWGADSAVRRYYFCALVRAYEASHAHAASLNMLSVLAYVARTVNFEPTARAHGLTPVVSLQYPAQQPHAASMDAFPLPLSYVDLIVRNRDVRE